jgi:DNA-binding NarL/FixJ family response regulator
MSADEVRVTIRNVNGLTPREHQVLEGLLQGHSTREIADSFGLCRQTVKNYVTTIYEKLGVRGRSQLLRGFGGYAGPSPAMSASPDA